MLVLFALPDPKQPPPSAHPDSRLSLNLFKLLYRLFEVRVAYEQDTDLYGPDTNQYIAHQRSLWSTKGPPSLTAGCQQALLAWEQQCPGEWAEE